MIYASVEYATNRFPNIRKNTEQHDNNLMTERRPNFNQDHDLLDFAELEKFSRNSEFILNHNENDKITVFNKIHAGKEALEQEFNRR